MKDSISIRSAVLSALNGKPSLLAPEFRNQLMDLLQDKAVINGTGLQKECKEQLASFYLASNVDYDRSYFFADGVAVIPIQGLLLNRLAFSGWGVTGYDYIRGAVNDAMHDDDVKGIIFDINSPGGSAQGCFELSEYIASQRSVKPMMGFINANACSGAYALGSAVGDLRAVKSADVGSIGVYSMHMDLSKMLDDFGVKVEFIYAGDHKVDGNMYEPLGEDARKSIQAGVDATYDQFTSLVAANRNIAQSAVVATQAQIYSAEDALSLGLIDSVTTAESAVAAFRSELSGSDSSTKEVTIMSVNTKDEAGNNVAAVNEQAIKDAEDRAVKAHIQRRKDITSCEEAGGREKLAAYLADETDLTPEKAKAVLATSPKEGAAAPAAVTPFEKAMGVANPDVHDEGADAAQPTGADRIIAAARKAGVLHAVK